MDFTAHLKGNRSIFKEASSVIPGMNRDPRAPRHESPQRPWALPHLCFLMREPTDAISTDISLVYFLVFSDWEENVGDPIPGHLLLLCWAPTIPGMGSCPEDLGLKTGTLIFGSPLLSQTHF